MSHVRTTYLETAAAVHQLLRAPELEAEWDEPSVLTAFSVRGLAGHLARSVFQVTEYLEAPISGRPPITAAVYFGELEGTSDIGSDLNMAVRNRGEETGDLGRLELVRAVGEHVVLLKDRLAAEPESRLVTAHAGRVLLLDEYLKTRLVEMVVHVEDLALSIGAGVGLPTEAIEIATDTAMAATRFKHGDLALLRGMTRRERDTTNATRLF